MRSLWEQFGFDRDDAPEVPPGMRCCDCESCILAPDGFYDDDTVAWCEDQDDFVHAKDYVELIQCDGWSERDA